jgi:hypothetical protein
MAAQSSHRTIAEIIGLRTIVRGISQSDPERDRRDRVEQHIVGEILVAARSLIQDEQHWCKGSWAIDKNGREWGPDQVIGCMPAYAARQFCAEGAIFWAAFWAGQPASLAQKAVDLLAGLIGTQLYTLNDDKATSHSMLLRLFDEGIAVALGEGR